MLDLRDKLTSGTIIIHQNCYAIYILLIVFWIEFQYLTMTHWSDLVAEELLKRGKKHVIETGTSISGIPHIGNASDVIRGDAVRKVIEEMGGEVKFIWVADDLDPFRRVPEGMDYLEEYLGHPVKDIPDPEGCHDSFVEHHVTRFLEDLKGFGVEPEVYSATELYRSGEFYKGIKTVMNNSEKIVEILNRFRKEPLPGDTVLWSPICERCGKISTTRAVGIDGDSVRYKCEDVEISGSTIKGCGFEGESNLKEGYGKLPWRVEWAMRWAHFKVTCEPLGKEHASAGGSFWTAKEICREVFGWEPPLPVIYEFFTLNGEKISSSKGNVITLREWLKICEPETLKFFMYKRLQKQRDINLGRIPAMVDEYDRAERIYFGQDNGGEMETRMYWLSQVSEPKFLGVPFTLCAVLSQIVPDLDIDEISKRLENSGYENFDTERLRLRLKLARRWKEDYGPEYLNFRLIDEKEAAGVGLDDKQRKGLKILAGELGRKFTPRELHKRIYEIARSIELEPERMFEAIYLILIGKRKGPKAAMFLLSLEKEFVRERLSGGFIRKNEA